MVAGLRLQHRTLSFLVVKQEDSITTRSATQHCGDTSVKIRLTEKQNPSQKVTSRKPSKLSRKRLDSIREKAAQAHLEVTKGFASLQVRVPPRPALKNGQLLEPLLPEDLTVLNDVLLGRLFSEFACMAQYVQLHLAAKSVNTAIKRRIERHIRASVRLEKDGTVEDKTAQVDVDIRSIDISFDLAVAEGVEVMTKGVMDMYVSGRDAISREITRRQMILKERAL